MSDLDPNKYRLSEAQHQAIFEKRIKHDLFAGAKQAEGKPVAVIFGGQPGAGKSAALDEAARELVSRGGAAQIIGDDLRGYHPAYSKLMAQDDKTAAFYTDRDTGRWVEKAIAHAKANNLNIIIEGTMRDSNTVAKTMTDLRTAGYEIDARVLAVNDRLSWQGVMQRYEGQKADRGTGRMTAPHSHQAAYEGMPVSVERIEREQLADKITVYRRGAEAIYSNTLTNGQWEKPAGARMAVEAERTRRMTLPELQAYAEGYDKLAAMVGKPGRNATGEEVANVDALRTSARNAWAAESFRQQAPTEAMKQHPQLAGAYATLAAVARQAESDGMSREQKEALVGRVKATVAAVIERGEAPTLLIRESQVRDFRASKDIER